MNPLLGHFLHKGHFGFLDIIFKWYTVALGYRKDVPY
jgi:hypothetical protein